MGAARLRCSFVHFMTRVVIVGKRRKWVGGRWVMGGDAGAPACGHGGNWPYDHDGPQGAGRLLTIVPVPAASILKVERIIAPAAVVMSASHEAAHEIVLAHFIDLMPHEVKRVVLVGAQELLEEGRIDEVRLPEDLALLGLLGVGTHEILEGDLAHAAPLAAGLVQEEPPVLFGGFAVGTVGLVVPAGAGPAALLNHELARHAILRVGEQHIGDVWSVVRGAAAALSGRRRTLEVQFVRCLLVGLGNGTEA